MGGDNTPSGVSPHPQGARLALRLVRQGDGIHYPLSFLGEMRQGVAVARKMSSGNQVRVGKSSTTSRTCSSSSLSLHIVCASRLTGGNAYLRKSWGQLCASASVPRGPSVREKYSWRWEESWEANRFTWASPSRLQISRIVSGWSHHSPGNVSCRESASAARLSFSGMWTAYSDLNCMWLQRRRWRASCDMRCDRIPPNRLIYETAAVLSVRTSTCLPNSSGRNCRKARCIVHSSNQKKIRDERLVEISTLLIHSAPKQKSNEWMHLSPFYIRMHGEWLRYAKSTSQFHWRFLLKSEMIGASR